jgi:magnesium-transporting ATPase (P-type)
MIENYDKDANLLAKLDTISSELHNKHINEWAALVIDGVSLSTVIKGRIEEHFRSVALKCDVVLCCRMSPVQKAMVKSLFFHFHFLNNLFTKQMFMFINKYRL